MTEKDKEGRTPAEERADIGTPAGEDAEEGRRRHGTQPLTEKGGVNLSQREKDEIQEDLEADQSARPEDLGEKVRGKITEENLEEEGGELGVQEELTGTEVSGGSHGHGHPEGGTPGGKGDKMG